jgi:hypothetical protein
MNLKTLGDFKKEGKKPLTKRKTTRRKLPLTPEERVVACQSSILMLLASWKRQKRTPSTVKFI